MVDQNTEDMIKTPFSECEESEDELVLGVKNEEDIEYTPQSMIQLPVGLEYKGTRYKNVEIEEMCGVDEHLLTTKEAKQNPAKGTTMVLGRCVQAVEGILEKKPKPDKQFDRSFGRNLTQVDRDYLLSRIQLLGGNNRAEMYAECPRCERVSIETVFLSELPVKEWPEDKPTILDFELSKGIIYTTEEGEKVVCKKGKIRFPTGKDQELAAQCPTTAAQMDSMLAACIVDIEYMGKLDQETVKRLSSTDRKEIMYTIQYELPGLRQWKETKCECGKTLRLRLDLTSFFDMARKKQKK